MKKKNKIWTYTKEYEQFWDEYPKRSTDTKYRTYKRFVSALTEITFEDLMKAVRIYKQSDDVKKGYNKMAVTFLNQKAYFDILEQKEKPSFIDTIGGILNG